MEWIAYHQHSADVYDAVADTDPTHRFQAVAWATILRVEAQTAEDRLFALLSARIR